MLLVNQLLYCSKEDKLFRVLWIDEGYVICYVIEIDTSTGFPQKKLISTLEKMLKNEEMKIVKDDPFLSCLQEDEISDKDKMIRNKAWEVLDHLVNQKDEKDLFEREKRGCLVKETSTKCNIAPKYIYKYLRRYWQRGQNKNALLPDYQNCGAAGRERKSGERKRGRPKKYPVYGIGINITDEIKRFFRIAINRYYHNLNENSLKFAYQSMLSDFFLKEDGTLQEEIPTIRQFRYWYEKEFNIEQKIKKRQGENLYNLQHRAVLGSSTFNIEGPGARYQIDATIADVYIVSDYNRSWIIGRPVLYIVIDVFSRMVVGMHVALEGPSWQTAMMALANVVTNKVEFCEKYDIKITKEEWDCHHLPNAILADRGELEGKSVETLINTLKVRVENTPPFRADWKGIVEQHFRLINERVKPILPGMVKPDFGKRGARDYRLDAKLTLKEFTKIIINCILSYNNNKLLVDYPLDKEMIESEIRPIPIELWRWGRTNRAGKLRTCNEDIVRLSLLPIYSATITRRGIEFRKMLYSCERAAKEFWFETVQAKGRKRVKVSVDPRNINNIYIRSKNGLDYDVCYLLEHQERYKDMSLDEIDYYQAVKGMQKKELEKKELENDIQLNKEIMSIVEQAIQKTNEFSIQTISDSEKKRNIKEKRSETQTIIREEEAFVLNKVMKDLNQKEERQSLKDNIEDEIIGVQNNGKLNLFRSVRREKMHGKKAE
ncbi:Mu transposase C-terminal domain-containing protein [Bacillus mobilis]|uniref:Mu transposase C-terminal domain-containing protein n=1 Tax=Bacillus mobilis TaxID=2026190 RepID=UPI0021CF9D1C|nr:Mu transposase C-terminal domain-containing protein [Bacillus mobilis]MCU5198026.1 Mu transposase C-terminal domain-containing protein [Bacillus mobilis]